MSETARQTASILGPDAKFGRAHVWHYLHGRAMPRARQLVALSSALDVCPDELLRSGSDGQEEEPTSRSEPVLRASDQQDGTVILEVSQRIPWRKALEILSLLKPTSDGLSSDNTG